ncbi:MAG TPA: alpha/beta hydrolase [Chitinophagales bacterium]|nr:alpha/beta hydrolase [Chitinophagales bacterium]
MKIYFLPGLGADRRMFQPQLAALPHAMVLEHLPPVKGETLNGYARRIAAGIDTSAPFIVIGASLGGMVAIEIAGFLKPEKIILLSSVKNRNEIPAFIRSMKTLRLHRLIGGNTFKQFNSLMARRLDKRGDGEIAKVIREMAADTPAAFIEWAIDAVINWDVTENNGTKIIHIHGTNDQLFPVSRINNPIRVQGGSHVMNLSKSEEVNRILLQHI